MYSSVSKNYTQMFSKHEAYVLYLDDVVVTHELRENLSLASDHIELGWVQAALVNDLYC